METDQTKRTKETKTDINTAGMYEILKIVMLILAQTNKNTIKTKDLEEKINLSKPAISNNLNRLTKANILIRIERRDTKRGRIVEYKLNTGGDIIEFILHNLY